MSLQETSFSPFYGSPVRELYLDRNFRIVERAYAPGMYVPLHAHDKAFVGVTLSGVYTQTHSGRTWKFRPGCISFMPLAARHESRYSESGARVLHLELTTGLLDELSTAGVNSETYTVLRGGASHVAAQQIYRELKCPDAHSPGILRGLSMRLLAEIFRHRQPSAKLPAKWLREAERHICENYAEALSLDEVARTVQVHPVHLAREYRRHYRRTVGERIRELRFEVACKELLSTSRSIVDIALSSGYSDQSHFSVAFKKQIGASPSEYGERQEVGGGGLSAGTEKAGQRFCCLASARMR
jgi:AraC family transcriptional regulator